MLDYDFMRTAFVAATIVAALAGLVGYFLVLRGQTFAGHALSHVGFTGATGAILLGVPPLWGLVLVTVAGGAGMGLLGDRLQQRDVAIGMVLSMSLGFGLLFLHFFTAYATQATALLFGNVLGVDRSTVWILLAMASISILGLAAISRPLLFVSLQPELAEARGVRLRLVAALFLAIVALATAECVQIVGVLLVFTLMVGPAAAAQQWTRSLGWGLLLSVVLALCEAWGGLALAYYTDWPASFWITALSGSAYLLSVSPLRRPLLAGLAAGALAIGPARAQTAPVASPEEIEVTATRIPEAVDTVPADITIIDGNELRARHATDLRSALALVPGVEAPSGGDSGPAGAVPSIWGLHEFDAFLLVVDGVPWGGAFNPAIPTLDLADVQRIEVLKGSAPVIYGATAFVGVIQVIHQPAGATPSQATIGGGEHGSARGQASLNLPSIGGLVQSLSLDGESLGFADPREGVSNGHALYRGLLQAGGGELRIDADIAVQHQLPSSPVIRQGSALTALTPLDENANPADARIDETRYHAVLGYTLPTRLGTWQSTVSLAYSDIADIRGFLRPDLTDDGSQNADSQNQRRHILDSYYDTHLAATPWPGVDVAVGADLLYGDARQSSINGAYYAPLSGSRVPPPTTALHVDEINTITDDREFAGQYLQADWKLGQAIDITGGVRLNETYEQRQSRHVDGFDRTLDLQGASSGSTVRPTETLGASFSPLPHARDALVLYADIRESFKPAAVDFGPDYTPDVLLPERALSYEAGIKGHLLHGRLRYGVEAFQLDFKNLVVATTAADGSPLMQNAGGERLRGAEAELVYSPLDDLSLHLAASEHEARFTSYIASEGGANVDASGKLLPLSPRTLLSAGAIYTPAQGLTAHVALNYIGRRFLDIANTAPVGAYATVDASLGYQLGCYALVLSGSNLSDERPPVTASEFGDQSFYRLTGRQVFLDASTSF